MKKWIMLLVVALLTAMLLTGCGGCMGCGGSDYADDGVVDGSSGAKSTDGITGGDSRNTADEFLDDADDMLDDAGDAVDDFMDGGRNVTGSTDVPSTGSGTNQGR